MAKDQAATDGMTPLIIAAQQGHLDIVRFLVEVGVAKDQAATDGMTPLIIAAQQGHLDMSAFWWKLVWPKIKQQLMA